MTEAKLKELCVVMILGVILMSCDMNVPVSLPEFQEKLVIESYLTVDDSIIVRIDKTLNPFVFPDRNNPGRRVRGAIVQLSVGDSIFQLRERTTPYGYYTGILYTDYRRVTPQTKYRISVDYQSLHAEAECTTFPRIRLTDARVSAQYQPREYNASFDLMISASFPLTESYYLVSLFAPTVPSNGSPYVTAPFWVNANHSTEFVSLRGVSKTSFVAPPSRFRVELRRIDKIYYDIYKAVEAQRGEYDSFLGSETTEIPTNIIGGYGIFTGMSKDTMSVVLQ